MKDAYEVLYQKEADIARLRKEIESLNLTAELLADDDLSFFVPGKLPDGQSRKPAQKETPVEATGTDEPLVRRRSGFWGNLRIRR